MSTSNLRDQLQIARINRTKQRVHTWWHREHCEACKNRMGLPDLIARIATSVRSDIEPDATAFHDAPPKAH